MANAAIAFGVLGLAMLTGFLAKRTSLPAPLVFAFVGIGAGSLWHLLSIPVLKMPPDIVLFAFLPPLLTAAAYALPLGSFRRNLMPIGLLAIGLVIVTIGVTATVGHYAAGLPWMAAVLLGAIVSPPDPVAATSVANRVGLPHRLVVVLEGEGLLNDAVAIVAYGLTIEAIGQGQFELGRAAAAIVREVPIGIAIGWIVGWSAGLIRRQSDSVPLEIGVSLVAPYLAYYLADEAGGSAVLAVVTLGFLLRKSALTVASPVARLAARTVWSFLRYASTALVFLLLGLLMGEVVVAWPSIELLLASLAVTAAIILTRFAWMLLVPRWAHALRLSREPAPTLREQLVLSWAGMRGVVSLALALALPLSLDAANRAAILFVTLIVIAVTLLVQGATLIPLIEKLGVGDPGRDRREEAELRSDAVSAAIAAAKSSMGREFSEADAVIERVQRGEIGIGQSGGLNRSQASRTAAQAALDAQRSLVESRRDDGRLGAALAERLETELDLDWISLEAEGAKLTDGGETG